MKHSIAFFLLIPSVLATQDDVPEASDFSVPTPLVADTDNPASPAPYPFIPGRLPGEPAPAPPPPALPEPRLEVPPDHTIASRVLDCGDHTATIERVRPVELPAPIVQNAAKDANALFNLYLIPGRINHRLMVGADPNRQVVAGYARTALRTPYLMGASPHGLGQALSTGQLLVAAPHEIGHSAVLPEQLPSDPNQRYGLSHPWQGGILQVTGYRPDKTGFPSLDMPTDRERLMWNQVPARDATDLPLRLNKSEADQLHTGTAK